MCTRHNVWLETYSYNPLHFCSARQAQVQNCSPRPIEAPDLDYAELQTRFAKNAMFVLNNASLNLNLEVMKGRFGVALLDKELASFAGEVYSNRLISAYRKKYYGFEYRTPGSWLLSPSTTLVTLTLAKLAVIGVTEDNLDFVEI